MTSDKEDKENSPDFNLGAHSMPYYSTVELAELVKQMEVKLGLLKDDAYGREARLVWESYRFTVHSKLKKYFSKHQNAHSLTQSFGTMTFFAKVRFALRTVYNAYVKNFLKAPREREFLIWANPRRIKSEDGFFDDPYTEQITSMIGGNEKVTIIERPYGEVHFKPVRNEIWHSDLQILISYLLRVFYSIKKRNTRLRNMTLSINEWFENSIGLQNLLIENELHRANRWFLAQRVSFRLMLKWLKPKKIILVCSYGQEPLIIAAKDLGIITVELQHGVISPFHIGYIVPENTTKLSFPDYLWVFGEYWKEIKDLPISKERIKIVGYPYFSINRNKWKKIKKRNQIVFISQGTIGNSLSKFACELAKEMNDDIKIFYKIHPGEKGRWRKEYPWLENCFSKGIIDVVENDTPSLYELLASSNWQIGVYSTAIFEGIGYGCNTILVDLPGIEYMEPLIKAGIVTVVRHPNEVNLSQNNPHSNIEKIFNPHWKKLYSTAIKQLEYKN